MHCPRYHSVGWWGGGGGGTCICWGVIWDGLWLANIDMQIGKTRQAHTPMRSGQFLTERERVITIENHDNCTEIAHAQTFCNCTAHVYMSP